MDLGDWYSEPVGEKPTALGRLFTRRSRHDPTKPGRVLSVLWDRRFPLVDGFECTYSYLITFDDRDCLAGNHYHLARQELFYPVHGQMVVALEDIGTGETEEVLLAAAEPAFLQVSPGIAHVVIAMSVGAILFVAATGSTMDGDEYSYRVRP